MNKQVEHDVSRVTGHQVMAALDPTAPPGLLGLPAVQAMQQIWIQ